jgi:hypothetical protein
MSHSYLKHIEHSYQTKRRSLHTEIGQNVGLRGQPIGIDILFFETEAISLETLCIKTSIYDLGYAIFEKEELMNNDKMGKSTAWVGHWNIKGEALENARRALFGETADGL